MRHANLAGSARECAANHFRLFTYEVWCVLIPELRLIDNHLLLQVLG
jgi:hypothetical protein